MRSNVEQATLRHSGHTQNPLSSAFPIILILIGAKVFIVWVGGGRRGDTSDDREDCYSFGRATVALTGSIQHTYIAAMLDWGLDTPFTSQDRPPLAIAMTATVDGTRGLRRYRLVICPESQVASQAGSHHSTGIGRLLITVSRPMDSSHVPLIESSCTAGYRSPLWICAAYDGEPVLVHRQRGTVLYFHQAISEKKIFAIPGIHYFDAHRLDALLLDAPDLQLRRGPAISQNVMPSKILSDEEPSTTDGEDTSEDDDSVDPKWCPPNPDAQDDPAEEELIGAAEKLDTMMARVQPPSNIFFTRESWCVTGSVASGQTDEAPFQEKFAKLFQTIAVELWLRGRSNDIRDTFQVVARSITIRVAEKLARCICSLMRTAATLATPEMPHKALKRLQYCPTREAPGMQRTQRDRVLQAVRFVDKKAPGIDLGIDEDYHFWLLLGSRTRIPDGCHRAHHNARI